MNTVADFYELVLQEERENERLAIPFPLRFVETSSCCAQTEEETPSLALSESSLSLDDSLFNLSQDQTVDKCGKGPKVKFCDYVEIREYSLSIGDHPMCVDGLPLTLGWSYAEPVSRHIDCSKYRGYVYDGPSRLSRSERKMRLLIAGDSDTIDENGELCDQPKQGMLDSVGSGISFLSILGDLHTSWTQLVPSYSNKLVDDRDDRFLTILTIGDDIDY